MKIKAVSLSRAALVALGALLFCPVVMGHPDHDGEDGHDPVPVASQEPAGRGGDAKNEVSITTEGDFRVIQSNGWPDHVPGTFPRKGNPNKLAPQRYTFKVPLKPKAEAALVTRGGASSIRLEKKIRHHDPIPHRENGAPTSVDESHPRRDIPAGRSHNSRCAAV